MSISCIDLRCAICGEEPTDMGQGFLAQYGPEDFFCTTCSKLHPAQGAGFLYIPIGGFSMNMSDIIRPCSHKKYFPTKSAAKRFSKKPPIHQGRRMDRTGEHSWKAKGQRVYDCPDCDGWHLTTQAEMWCIEILTNEGWKPMRSEGRIVTHSNERIAHSQMRSIYPDRHLEKTVRVRQC